MTKEYQLEIRIRNNLILARMKEQGIESIAELSRLSGVSVTTLHSLVSLKRPPISKRGTSFDTWTEACTKMACALGTAPDLLFTERQRLLKVDSNRKILLVEEAQLLFALNHTLPESNPEKLLMQTDRGNQLERMLLTLTPRQAQVLRLRFGLDDQGERTLEETAKYFAVTKERIRQIEIKAIRLLRKNFREDEIRAVFYSKMTRKEI